MEKTIQGFVEGFIRAGQAKNMQLLHSHVTDDCRRYIGPKSFIVPKGAPPDFSMSNDEYAAEFSGMELYQFEDYTIFKQVIDTENLKAVIYAEVFIRFNAGDKASRNFVWFFDFVEDGSKIREVYQHNDTEEANNWLKDIQARKEAKRAAGVSVSSAA